MRGSAAQWTTDTWNTPQTPPQPFHCRTADDNPARPWEAPQTCRGPRSLLPAGSTLGSSKVRDTPVSSTPRLQNPYAAVGYRRHNPHPLGTRRRPAAAAFLGFLTLYKLASRLCPLRQCGSASLLERVSLAGRVVFVGRKSAGRLRQLCPRTLCEDLCNQPHLQKTLINQHFTAFYGGADGI